jgi:hypothetical protein
MLNIEGYRISSKLIEPSGLSAKIALTVGYYLFTVVELSWQIYTWMTYQQ